jgi:hypothetical protein
MFLETLGLFGVFLAGAIPWFEAIAVVPTGILIGLNPIWVVLFAVTGNAITIGAFAYAGDRLKSWWEARRQRAGKSGESKKMEKASRAFDRYGFYGMALLGPILIGTQFSAAVSVAAGVKPLKATIVISLVTLLWAVGIALASVAGGLDQIF